jgi:hypothetical protein
LEFERQSLDNRVETYFDAFAVAVGRAGVPA